jgi:glycosyltransferase involved in cell wall biosynthesis
VRGQTLNVLDAVDVLDVLILGCKDYPAFSTPRVHSGGMEVYTERMVRSLADRARFTLYTAGGASDGAATVVPLGAARGLRSQPVSLMIKSRARLRGGRPPFALLNPQTPLAALAAREVKRRYGIPYVVTVHIFGADPAHAGSRLAAWAYSRLERLVFSDAAAIIPTGRRLGKALERRYQGIGSRISVVTAAGLGVRKAAPTSDTRARLGIQPDEKLLLFLGRLVEENGIGDLLATVAQLRQDRPQIRLLIAGSGDREKDVERRIRMQGLGETVRMIGRLRGQEKLDVLAAAEVMVRASRHEVFPEAYIEALSVGTPVAATPAGDTADLAAESGAIALLPFGDPKGQAAVLDEILQTPERRAEMSERALEYSRRVVWDRQKELYWDVLERAAGRSGAA